ncbi:MAG: aldo/keto reductase, partial [bacterium]|nr:aldo/keto reductase [bacterium]
MRNNVTRRTFLGGAVAGVAASASQAKLPTRALGRTGVQTPILGIGCGMSWWEASKTEDRALEALEVAADVGITYFDTGQG